VGTAAAQAAGGSAAPAFVAPDGRGFHDRSEYRRYIFDTFYTFRGRRGETLTKLPGDIGG